MDTAMTQEDLVRVLDQAVREVTEQVSGVKLYPDEGALSEDLYTIYISFNKGFHTSLSLCADTALLIRMAQNAWGEEIPITSDIEDFCMEYFNILCGKIAAVLFRNTEIPARFSVPAFYHGRFTPENHRKQFVLTYADGHQQGAHLTHYVPQARESNGECGKAS